MRYFQAFVFVSIYATSTLTSLEASIKRKIARLRLQKHLRCTKLSMVISHNIIQPCGFIRTKGAHIPRGRKCPCNDALSNINTVQRSGLPFTSVNPNPLVTSILLEPCGSIPLILEYVNYIMSPNKVVIFIYYSYIHDDTWKFGWKYTLGLLTIITIHMKHYSSGHCSLKILFIIFIPALFTLHIGIVGFL